MKRFSFVFIPALSAALLSLTGCDQSGSTKVCVDQDNRRIDDAQCQGRGQSWRYYSHGASIPGVGFTAAGGSSAPAAGESYGVARGGFGEGGEGHGGFGE